MVFNNYFNENCGDGDDDDDDVLYFDSKNTNTNSRFDQIQKNRLFDAKDVNKDDSCFDFFKKKDDQNIKLDEKKQQIMKYMIINKYKEILVHKYEIEKNERKKKYNEDKKKYFKDVNNMINKYKNIFINGTL